MEFTCPTCQIVLQAQKIEDIRLWKCSTCHGFAISLPVVRKGLQSKTFKKIWQQLFSGEYEQGRACPGCKKPLCVVEADGQDSVLEIDVCRSCQILWFDEKEYADLPKVVAKIESPAGRESRLLTPEELTFAAFKKDHDERRSLLFKLLDGSVSKKFELNSFFGDFFDK
jgi:Zn-finger nucleic acid-binding protein